MDFGSEGTSIVGSQMYCRTATIALLILCAYCAPAYVFSALGFSSFYFAQTEKPEWCRNLPRPEYKSLEQIPLNDPWFEVYKVAPATFAIYEPHQAEEVISYLIVGTKQALLFDTGMGIGNIKAVVARLTSRPIVVLNSHTHDDHVGGNWQFPFVYGVDTAFTRANAKGSREDAQAEIGKVQPQSVDGDQATYQVGEISFRLRHPLPALKSSSGTN